MFVWLRHDPKESRCCLCDRLGHWTLRFKSVREDLSQIKSKGESLGKSLRETLEYNILHQHLGILTEQKLAGNSEAR